MSSPAWIARSLQSRMLNARVSRLVDLAFAEPDRSEARATLKSCKPHWPNHKVRCQIAAIKLSRGDLKVLATQVKEAGIDLRDLLMAADFAQDTEAHLTWEPDW